MSRIAALVLFALVASCTDRNPDLQPTLTVGGSPPPVESPGPKDPPSTPDAGITPDTAITTPDTAITTPDTAVSEPDTNEDAGSPDAEIDGTTDTAAPDEGPPACPGNSPLIQATIGNSPTVKVGNVGAFDAHPTISYHGGFTVEWSVQAPAGSTSSFIPSANAVSPIFLYDVPGEYVFSIEVEDDCGLVSEFTWPVHTATPKDESGLRVQLSWVGEGGESHTGYNPHGVADLGLHFVHPQAPFDPEQVDDFDGDDSPDPYFDPYGGDCYSDNGSPDWGVKFNWQDNPEFPSGNYQSAPGPEVATLEQPEALKYRIAAVHNGGWGPGWGGAPGVPSPSEALALVTVLKDGIVMSTAMRDLVPGDLWCVGMVHGITGAVTPCPNLADPVTPDYPTP